jgi:hypothetical protein
LRSFSVEPLSCHPELAFAGKDFWCLSRNA